MNGAAIAIACLCGALGLALTFSKPRVTLLSLGIVAASALAAALFATAAAAPLAVPAAWLSVMATALAVYWPGGVGIVSGPALALNAGAWCGILIAGTGTPDIALFMGLAGLAFPARRLAASRLALALRIAASWLVAVAALAIALPLVATPGYQADHSD